MIQQDFYSGQPSGLPPQDQQEMEAAQVASFGKYDYDPGMRAMNQQYMINPGGYGFNSMNPPTAGLGTPLRYSPNGNVMPTYGYFQPNPVFQNPYYQQQIQQQTPTVYHIPGVGGNGEYLPPADFQERIDQLERDYWMKLQEQQAKQTVDQRSSVYGYNSYYGGYNYYGAPYYNPYQYNSLNSELTKEIDEMKQSAKEARLKFDLNLANLAHNIAGHNVDQEGLKERYLGKDIELQRTSFDPKEYQEQWRLNNLVPFDNSQFYRDQWQKVSDEFNKVISKDATLKDTFLNMGIVYANWELEDEAARRRDVSGMYNSSNNAYKYYVQRKAQERYAREKGINIPTLGSNIQFNPDQAKKDALNQFPTLQNAVKLADDGSLNVTCNFGSNAGRTYSVINDNEAKYEEKRERFNRFFSSIPGSIYLNHASG